jgi:rsbT antagonist protein RsbS
MSGTSGRGSDVSHGVAILPQGQYLIASVQEDLSDSEVLELRDDLAGRIGRKRVRGIVVDVTALDVIDSFVARALQALAVTAKLRGAETVIVGIQPEVAIAMVHFKLDLAPLRTALDLDAALAQLDCEAQRDRGHG